MLSHIGKTFPSEGSGCHHEFSFCFAEDHTMRTRRPVLRGTSHGRARRPAATTVEFVPVALVFFMLVLGIFEIGRAFMTQHLLTNAAREGCRVGVLQGRSTSQITTAVNNTLAGHG